MQYIYFNNPLIRIKESMCDVRDDLHIDMIKGYVFQCLKKYINYPLGNIKKDSILDMWNSKNNLHDKMTSCKHPCHEVINCCKVT